MVVQVMKKHFFPIVHQLAACSQGYQKSCFKTENSLCPKSNRALKYEEDASRASIRTGSSNMAALNIKFFVFGICISN